MADPKAPRQSSDLNYFVCTLDQAARVKNAYSPKWPTVNDFIDQRAITSPTLPAFGFPVPLKDQEENPTEWGFAIHSFNGLKERSIDYAKVLREPLVPVNPSKTVALLCPSSPTFLFSWLGLMRLGFSVLLIAPQCQPDAIAHLCKECKVNTLLFDVAFHDLATNAQNSSAADNPIQLIRLPDETNETGFFMSPRQPQHEERPREVGIWPSSENDNAYLFHTSGTSSGLPKPVAQNHHGAVGVLPFLAQGKDEATLTITPLYHGGIADCFRAWTSQAMIWLFPARDTPITATNILKSVRCSYKATQLHKTPAVRYFSSVPFVLQMLAEDREGLQMLKTMSLVGVGGAALPEEVGNNLVAQAVNLVSRYGSAECGFLLSSHRSYATDKAWAYLRDNKFGYLSFERRDDGLSELIVNPSWPHMAKTNRDNGAYATADLFEAHADIADAWRYHSRADAQLTLMTGKKFDPEPLEAAMATHPFISEALIFGNGRLCAGVLVFPSAAAGAEVSEEVWQHVEKLNVHSQSHARISKSMVTIMPFQASTLAKSSKGTIMRRVAEKKYASYIDNAYGDSDEHTGRAIPNNAIPARVRQIVTAITGIQASSGEDEGHGIAAATGIQASLGDDEDLFSLGVDSIAAMRIRQSLQKELNIEHLPLNIVYDCGTLGKLSAFLVAIREGSHAETSDEIQEMRDLVSKYGNFGANLAVSG